MKAVGVGRGRQASRGVAAALAAVVTVVGASLMVPTPTAAAAPEPEVEVIVALEPAAAGMAVRGSAEVARRHGVQPTRSYSRVLRGFAGSATKGEIDALRADPAVQAVYLDGILREAATDEVPVSVRRVGADTVPGSRIGSRTEVDVDIAILDTGVAPHPDLNIAGAVDCTKGGACVAATPTDQRGHGTHVAGTAAARDNGVGVVGTAPGARVWSVKVLGDDGSGKVSWFLNGLEWAAAHGDIEIANASLGGPASSVISGAVDRAARAGLVLVTAAGNDGVDAATASPANAPGALTVSAYADTDGKPGGLGARGTCDYDSATDDSMVRYSNFGAVVDFAAPGDCILSTSNTGGYTVKSGTSMAAPHVAGAAATYVALNDVPRTSARSSTVHNALRHTWAAGQRSRCGVSAGRSDEPVLLMGGCPGAGDTVGPTPVNLTGTAGATSTTLEWSAATDPSGVSQYAVYRAPGRTGGTFVLKATLDEAARGYEDREASDASTYRYYVRAVDASGNTSTSDTVLLGNIDTSPPSAPVLTGGFVDGRVELTWSRATDAAGIREYVVFRESTASNEQLHRRASVGPDVLRFRDSYTWAGVPYTYLVVAYDNEGNLSLSDEVTVVPSADVPLAAPVLKAFSDQRGVYLGWSMPMDEGQARAYEIERAHGDGPFTPVATVSNRSTYVDTPATGRHSLRYRVRAVDAQGRAGDFSAPVSVDVNIDFPSAVQLSASPVGDHVRLTWTPSTSSVGIGHYEIFRTGPDGTRSYSRVEGSSTTYDDHGVAVGSSYSYEVHARDKRGVLGDRSNVVTVTVTGDVEGPSAVRLSARASDSRVRLSWTPATDPSGVDSYQILRSRNGDPLEVVAVASEAAYLDTGLTAGTSYRYAVRGVDTAHNVGALSNEVTATTPRTRVVVKSVRYAAKPAKADGTRPVTVVLALVSGNGLPVANARLTYQVRTASGAVVVRAVGRTRADGTFRGTVVLPAKTCYTTRVTKITVTGRTWDGKTPPNSRCL